MHFINILESREYLITLAKLATPNEDNSWLPEFQGKICQLLSVLIPRTELSSVVEGTELHYNLSNEWKDYNTAQEELKSLKVKTTYINDKLCYAYKGVGYQVNTTYQKLISETSFVYPGEEGYDSDNTTDDGTGGGEWVWDGEDEYFVEYDGVQATVIDKPVYEKIEVCFFIQRIDADRITRYYGDPEPKTYYEVLDIESRQFNYCDHEISKDLIEVEKMRREILNRRVAEFIGTDYSTVVAVFGEEILHLNRDWFSISSKKGIGVKNKDGYSYLDREIAELLIRDYKEALKRGDKAVIKDDLYTKLPNIAFINLVEAGYIIG